MTITYPSPQPPPRLRPGLSRERRGGAPRLTPSHRNPRPYTLTDLVDSIRLAVGWPRSEACSTQWWELFVPNFQCVLNFENQTFIQEASLSWAGGVPRRGDKTEHI